MTETQLKLAGTKRELSHIIVKCGDSAAGIRPGRFPDSVIGIWSLHLSALSLQLLQRNAPPVTPVTGGVAEWTQQARPSSHWFAGVRPKSQGDSHWCIPDQSLRWGGAAPVAWPGQIPCVPCSWRKGGPPEPQGMESRSAVFRREVLGSWVDKTIACSDPAVSLPAPHYFALFSRNTHVSAWRTPG